MAVNLFAENVTATLQTGFFEGEILLGADITNNGTSDLFGSVNNGFYLSADTIFDANDVLLYSTITLFTEAGTSDHISNFSSALPAGLAPGTYYVFADADINNEATESDETDNASANYATFTITGLDLTATNVTLAETNLGQGETTSVSFNLNNSGNAAITTALNVGVYLSTDNIIDENDILIGGGSVPPTIPANTYQTLSQNITLAADLAAGTYYIGVIADNTNVISELDETNNASLSPVQITVTETTPDLTISNLAMAETDLLQGQTVDVTYTLNNTGNQNADSFFSNAIYLSTDNIIDENDIVIGGPINQTLDANSLQNYTNSVTLDANLAVGTYYIGVMADYSNAIAEGDESNNFSPTFIEVTVGASSPDLTTSNTVLNHNNITAGANVVVSYDINNIGNASTTQSGNSFSTAVYLSTDNIIDENDILLTTRLVDFGIAANGSYSFQDSVNLPAGTTPGDYYIGVIADNMGFIDESNEANNSSVAPAAITISAPAPDLEASNVSVSSNALDAGDNITISFDTQNNGTASAGSYTTGVYLSTDNIITADDILIGTSAFNGTIPAGFQYNVTNGSVTIPGDIAGGTYYIGVVADIYNEVAESDETNNATTAPTSLLISAPSDLTPSNVTISSNNIFFGDSVDVTFDVSNITSEAEGPFSIGVYISTDNVITTDDTLLNIVGFDEIAANGTLENILSNVTIHNLLGLDAGDYYIGVYVDYLGIVNETSELNNAAVSTTAITVQTPYADLVVNDLQLSTTTLYPGTALEVTYDLTNSGQLASGTFTSTVYLSTDSTITTSDYALNTLSGLTLDINGNYDDLLASLTLPTSLPAGTYYLGVMADSGAAVAESNEANNISTIAITITADPNATVDPLLGDQWYIDNPNGVTSGNNSGAADIDMNIIDVWADYTGDGVKVAVYDDGFDYNHVDIDDNYDASAHITYNGAVHDPLASGSDAHGQAVIGLIGAEKNGIGTVGIAYDATLTGVDIFSTTTLAQEAGFMAQQANFDVVNHSWGYNALYIDSHDATFDGFLDALQTTADTGRDGLGTIMVAAGGNDRGSSISASRDVNDSNFMNSRYTVTVGAVNFQGNVSDYSTSGAALLVSAVSNDTTIGGGLWTTDRTGSDGYSNGTNESGNFSADYTNTFGGTSAASPIIAGVVALLLEANPALGWRDVQTILSYAARQTGSEVGATTFQGAEHYNWAWNGADNWNGGGLHFSNDYGFGLVDALVAVRLGETWNTQQTSTNEVTATGTVSLASLAIPDNDAVGVSFTVTINNIIDIESIALDLGIAHTYANDITVKLTSPDGTVSTVFDRAGGGTDFSDWTFTSNAFRGESSNGVWTVTVIDHAATDTGTLSGATLTAYGSASSVDDTYVYTNEFGDYGALAGRGTLGDGSGIDTLNAAAITTDSIINLESGATSTLAGQSLVTGGGTVIENAYSGDGNDTLSGNSANNILNGGRGNDTVSYASDSAGVQLNLTTGAVTGTASGIDALANIENAIGGSGDDDLTGSLEANTLTGGAGDDKLAGLGGNDVLDGGDGIDAVDYSANNAGVTANLATGTATGVGVGTDSLLNIEDFLGGNGADFVVGSTLDNTIFGNGGNDYLQGRDGNDTLFGGVGEDVLLGQNDDDDLYGGGGNDQVFGQAGNDTLDGGDGDDIVSGGLGNDTISGGAGIDIVLGGGGDDVMNGNDGDDTLSGGGGIDTLNGDAGNDLIVGAAGNDILNGGAGDDVLSGGNDDDTVNGDDGNDQVFGAAGNDILDGGIGNDTVSGGAGIDTVSGGSGQDTVLGSAGNDTLYGNDDNDTLSGGDDNDLLYGGNGVDTVLGGNGDDSLFGDDGNDLLFGGIGQDTLDGGLGNDFLYGQGGNDTFVFSGAFGNDVIVGFDAGNSAEQIDVSAIGSLSTFADVIANANYNGTHTTITDGANSIRINNVNLTDLIADDFIF